MLLDAVQRTAEWIAQRRNARLSLAYKRALLGEDGQPTIWAQQMLSDLARFCRANETTFHQDERLHVLVEGRREVWLRIQRFLNISEADLAKFVEVDDE